MKALLWTVTALAVSHVSALRADKVEQGVRDSLPSGLLAGVARADITPPVGIAQLNWGSQTHVEAAGIDPSGMTATAMVISDGKQKFALVDVDTGGDDGLEAAVEQAAALTGIPAAHIRLSSSHTHAGPAVSRTRGPAGTDYDRLEPVYQNYRKGVADKIVGAIVEANGSLKPVHFYGARGIGTININRRVRANGELPAAVGRNPEGFVDRDLVVARIDDAQGNPYAILVNYQCHGTVMGFENDRISPDWVGAMRRVVEASLPGSRCLFFQGAAGNQGPIEGFTGDLSVAHRLGAILGHQVATLALGTDTVLRAPHFEGFVESTAYQAKQPWRVSGPRESTLRFASKMMELPRRKYTAEDLAEMQNLVNDARARLEAATTAGDEWKRHQANARLRRFSDLLRKWQRPHDPTPLRVGLQVLRVGDIAMVSMPGEPFGEIGVAVKEASPFPVTMFCGYSSGPGGGYMPVASEYRLGGYEVQMTPYAPEAANMVVNEAAELLRQVK